MDSTGNVRGQSSNPLRHGEPQIPGVYSEHYGAFQKDKIEIPVNSFVLISSNEHFPHIGYIMDLYGKKGSMKAKVRWFRRYLELKDKFNVLDPNSEEIIYTDRTEEIDVETIDSIATVLTLNHYNRCSERINDTFQPLAYSGIFLCCKQIAGSRIKPFKISQLPGYSNQTIHRSFHKHKEPMNQRTDIHNPEEHTNQSMDIHNHEEHRNQSTDLLNLSMPLPKKARSQRLKKKKIVDSDDLGTISAERLRISDGSCSIIEDENMMSPKMKLERLMRSFGNEFDWSGPVKLLPRENENVEVLHPRFQGRWYKCQILVESSRLIKVEYRDKHAGELEEILPAADVAPPDRLGMRLAGRLTVRPSRSHPQDSSNYSHQLGESVDVVRQSQPQDSSNLSFQLGDSVDVLWNKSWCEGVVISPGDISTPHTFLVYLPGENLLNFFDLSDLRVSKDWINNKWKDIPRKMDILSVISSMLAAGAGAGAGANP